jgi:hypothetical protein
MESNFENQPPSKLVNDIMAGLRSRYAYLNAFHYEAAWSDSLGVLPLLPRTPNPD